MSFCGWAFVIRQITDEIHPKKQEGSSIDPSDSREAYHRSKNQSITQAFRKLLSSLDVSFLIR